MAEASGQHAFEFEKPLGRPAIKGFPVADGKIILAAIGKTSGGEFKLFVGKAAYNFKPIDLE